MTYCGTAVNEVIYVHPNNNIDEHGTVIMRKDAHESVFNVLVVGNEHAEEWTFAYECNTDYERVKLCIFDMIAEVDTMDELQECLSVVFAECFDYMLVDAGCCGNCESCMS